MKRIGFLYEDIISFDNIRLAWLKARRGKGYTSSVRKFKKDVNENLNKIRARLMSDNPDWGHYREFLIKDPKERIISAATFEERIMHHAIMNVVEPVIERQMIYHTYACRIGKGTHRAVSYVANSAKKFPYFLKLDVRKYFDSIDHDILKKQLIRIIKDSHCLSLLYGVIDSYCKTAPINDVSARGLPIGNLTSQFFANLYLSSLDHYVLEKIHNVVYCRYMDDIIILGTTKKTLRKSLNLVQTFCNEKLHLTLKQPVLSSCVFGIPFLGYRISYSSLFHIVQITFLKHTRQRRQRTLRRINHLYNIGALTQEKAIERTQCVRSTANYFAVAL